MNEAKKSYQKKKSAAIVIQQKWRATLTMCRAREEFQSNKKFIVNMQRRIRANQMCKLQRMSYLRIILAVYILEMRFLAQLMRKHRDEFQLIVKVKEYVAIRQLTVTIQRHFLDSESCDDHCASEMASNPRDKKGTRSILVVVQQRFCASQLMKKQRAEFVRLKTATITVQRCFRSVLRMKQQRAEYLKIQSATDVMQRHYRAFITGRQERQQFLAKKNAAIKIQQFWSGYQQMKHQKQTFQKFKEATS